MAATSPTAKSDLSQSKSRVAWVDLLCRLENKLAQIAEIKQSGATFEKLEAAKLMLVELIDFAESNVAPEQVELLAPRIQAVFNRTKELEELLQKSSWGLVQRLFSNDQSSRFEIDFAYEELSKDYVVMIVEFFVHCVGNSQNPPSEKRTIISSVEAFVAELSRCW